MAFSESWVESDPDGSIITVSLLDDYQRAAKRQIRERLEGDPASANSGIFESGSFGTTAIVRAGTARAYAVTAANLGTLTLQDGRIAITTDTNRLYHLKATGFVELNYAPLDGSRAFTSAVTFNAGFAVAAGGISVTGNSTFSANVTAASFTGPVTGNASTATALQTARTINGVAFDGTANITVAAAAGTLTGTALPATVVASSLTSVGTLGSLGVTGAVTAGSFSGPLTGNVTGTASVATVAVALQTARTIAGSSFDGTANINISAGNLTGPTLAAAVTASSLTSVGTLTSLAVTGLTDTGSLKVGGGAVITKILTATTIWDPASTLANNTATTTVAVTGAVVGDPVLVSQDGITFSALFTVWGYVSSAGIVTLVWTNLSGGALDPPSTTFRVFVFHA